MANKKFVKREKKPENITITMSELVLQNVDRSRADLRKWWYGVQVAENITNPNRSILYDLGERAIMDGHLTGVIEKRITAVLNKNLHYEVDGKRVQEMEDNINSDKFRLLMRLLWTKKIWGISGIEFINGSTLDFVEIPRKHLKPEKKILSREQNGQEGIDYTTHPLIHVVEDVERFGLIRKSIPYTLLKNGSLSDLAQYIELYGQPIRKGTYPADDPEIKAELKKSLKESGASFTVMVPEGTNIEIIGDHVTNGNGQVHEVMFKRCNNELSILWLGNTETTSNDNGGSDAKSKIQQEQQNEIHKSDITDMQDILSNFDLQVILDGYGWPVTPGKGKFVFEKEVNLEALKNRKEIDQFVSQKVPVGDDYWYETYGIPKPDNYDELKAQMEAEKVMRFMQEGSPDPTQEPTKKPKAGPNKNYQETKNLWYKFRNALADFFDPAP